MITELKKQDFNKIKHIIDSCKNIEVRAVFSGNNPGTVYVDNSNEPLAALVWIQGHKGFQIIGEPQSRFFDSGLERHLRYIIEPNLKKRSINYVEIGAEAEVWNSALQTILSDRNMTIDIQHVFNLKDLIVREPAVTDAIIKKIDGNILNPSRLENHSFLEEKILEFWDSIASFLENGLGFYAEKENKLISLCFSAFVADHTHAVEIETLKEYRERKLGTAVASRFIQECTCKGIRPYWDCSPDNIGSIRLAKAVGLTHEFDYQIFSYELE